MVSTAMWEALVFLAVNGRWRKSTDMAVARLSTMRALARRGLAEIYPNLTEAWIVSHGIDFLISHTEDILIEYALPDSPSSWCVGDQHPSRRTRDRLFLKSRQVEVEERLTTYHHGAPVLTRIRFVRREEHNARQV